MAPQIVNLIFTKYFTSKKMKGHNIRWGEEGKFLKRINGTLIYLVCAVLCQQLKAYEVDGHFHEPLPFNRVTALSWFILHGMYPDTN